MKKQDDDIVLCRAFESNINAHIAQGVLEEHGIRSIIDNQIFGSILPISINGIGSFRLMVYRKDLDEATRLVDQTGLE